MVDSAFVVTDANWSRLATLYVGGDGPVTIRPMKEREIGRGGRIVNRPLAYHPSKRYFSGGSGLVSTASDYARFLQMLMNGGKLAGVQLLSRKSVELMTISHTRDMPHDFPDDDGTDFGLGFGVVVDAGAAQKLSSVGAYGWSGFFGTVFFVDPKERLFGVLLAQRVAADRPWFNVFNNTVYQALQ